MSDLQEIRRFWTIDLSTDWPSGYVRKNGRMRWSVYFDSGWNVKVLWRGNARQGSGMADGPGLEPPTASMFAK